MSLKQQLEKTRLKVKIKMIEIANCNLMAELDKLKNANEQQAQLIRQLSETIESLTQA